MSNENKNEDPSTWKKFSAWVNGEKACESNKEESEPVRESHLLKDDTKAKEVVDKEVQRKKSYNSFMRIYKPLGAALICAFVAIVIIVCAYTPKFGVADAPTNNEVSQKYIEEGLEDTGATNIVSGMILDYRAFDTLGEATVLFSAVMAVMILLRKDEGEKKYESDLYEEKVYKEDEAMYKKKPDSILSLVSKMVAPFILMYGAYVILNGHLSPGGGFSGGAIIGAGLILISVGVGPSVTKKFFNFKVFTIITSGSLLSYAALKTYSFFTGANHIGAGVPKGIAGMIVSSGFILPLNIFVGMIVACTMFGFYSLFTKGEV